MDAGDDRAVLLDFLSTAQGNPKASTIFKDLSDAGPGQAYEAIRFSEAVFVVSTTDPASVEEACAHAALVRHILRSLRRDDACGLLLVPTPGGIPEVEAEQWIGLPMCGVLRSPDHIAQLARCIAQD
jgi:hypothetical protein